MTETITLQKNMWADGPTGTPQQKHEVIDNAARASIVMLGESHDRAEDHAWQLDVSMAIHKINPSMAMGFEMFPKRLQPVLDQWRTGELSDEDFLLKTDWKTTWGFDPELYLPLFRFCKTNDLPMLALNCNRDLVSEIGKQGWEDMEITRLEGLTPAKPATTEYRQYLFDITGGPRPDRKAAHAGDPAFDRFVRAQQVWDRAFACNLAGYHASAPDTLLIGIIGRGHLEYRGGTPFQLDDLGITDNLVLLPTDEEQTPLFLGDYIYRY